MSIRIGILGYGNLGRGVECAIDVYKRQVNRQRPFGAKDKWSYAMGDLGCNMSFALNSYLMLFYTQYIGLDLGTWGIIILLLKIWDAINDPIMGCLLYTSRCV